MSDQDVEERVEERTGDWTSELQSVVDEASRVLGRPIAIDDRNRRLIAYTQHGEDEVDRVRLLSIMKQPLPAEAIEWANRFGSPFSEHPFKVPRNAELAYDARAAAPLRCQGHRLGVMWCIDRDQTMSDADLARMAEFADDAAVVLHRELLLQDLNRSRERELLRDILSSDEELVRDAAWHLSELDLFVTRGRLVVLVIPLPDTDDGRAAGAARVAYEAALMRIRRHLAPKHGLHLVRPSHALVLVSLADPGIRVQGISAFASLIHEEWTAAFPAPEGDRRWIVAVGGVAQGVTRAPASYRQALSAANVAGSVSNFGDVVCWDELGIYQMLTELPIDGIGPSVLHPGLMTLLSNPRMRHLVATLERYFDFAGDTQKTASSLYLHRTSLYQRLRRVERVAEVDLANGDDRLALHLSLKLARLQGITWADQDDGDDDHQE